MHQSIFISNRTVIVKRIVSIVIITIIIISSSSRIGKTDCRHHSSNTYADIESILKSILKYWLMKHTCFKFYMYGYIGMYRPLRSLKKAWIPDFLMLFPPHDFWAVFSLFSRFLVHPFSLIIYFHHEEKMRYRSKYTSLFAK